VWKASKNPHNHKTFRKVNMKDKITIDIHIDDQPDQVGISTEIKCNGKTMSEWVEENGEESVQVKIVRDVYTFLLIRSDPEKVLEIPKFLHEILLRESLNLPIEETIEIFRTLGIVPATATSKEAESIVEMTRALLPSWGEMVKKAGDIKEEIKEAPQSMMFGLSKVVN